VLRQADNLEIDTTHSALATVKLRGFRFRIAACLHGADRLLVVLK
jgi:hypothetical protein